MIVKDLIALPELKVENLGNDQLEITKPFCCDLLSIAMSKAPQGACWVTIMGNINSLAVASLTESACIILASGVKPDDVMLEKAKKEDISIFSSELPVFETALLIYNKINA